MSFRNPVGKHPMAPTNIPLIILNMARLRHQVMQNAGKHVVLLQTASSNYPAETKTLAFVDEEGWRKSGYKAGSNDKQLLQIEINNKKY
jgi:hypothetical protein